LTRSIYNIFGTVGIGLWKPWPTSVSSADKRMFALHNHSIAILGQGAIIDMLHSMKSLTKFIVILRRIEDVVVLNHIPHSVEVLRMRIGVYSHEVDQRD